MNKSLSFYNQKIETYRNRVASNKKRLLLYSSLRLIVFLLTTIGIYFTFTNWQLALTSGVLGIGVFVYLLSKYTDTKAKRELNKALLKINLEELKIASGDYHHRDSGLQFQDLKHDYSLDIDLFGKGSFFQYTNRTISKEGQHKLSEVLKANDILNIEERQEAIKELSENIEWTQVYSATGSLIQTETKAQSIIHWLKTHQNFIPIKMKWVPWLITLISIGLLTLAIFKIIDIYFFGYWLFSGLGFTGLYLKKN